MMSWNRINAVSAVLLATLYFSWWTVIGQPDGAAPVMVSIGMLPIVFSFGLWRGGRFSTTFTGFMAPFYFSHGVMELFANPSVRPWVAVETFLTALLFLGCMLSLRASTPVQVDGN